MPVDGDQLIRRLALLLIYQCMSVPIWGAYVLHQHHSFIYIADIESQFLSALHTSFHPPVALKSYWAICIESTLAAAVTGVDAVGTGAFIGFLTIFVYSRHAFAARFIRCLDADFAKAATEVRRTTSCKTLIGKRSKSKKQKCC